MKINVWECVAAGAIIVFGVGMAYFGSSYGVGSLGQMGAGYFPVILGVVAALFGVATLLEVWHSDNPPPQIPWRAFFCVFSGILVWSLLVERVGLLPSSALLIIFGSLGRTPVRVRSMLLTAAFASVASVLLFIHAFSLPLQAVRW